MVTPSIAPGGSTKLGQLQTAYPLAKRLWLQSDIFGGADLLGSYEAGLIEDGIVVLFMLCFSVRWDFRRGKQMKYGRLLRGPVMQTPKEFNKTHRGAGIGLVTNDKKMTMPSRSGPSRSTSRSWAIPGWASQLCSNRCWSKSKTEVSLATRLGPLRRFVLAHPWDVDVEGVGFCWSVARRA
jgi:hypothetical protein